MVKTASSRWVRSHSNWSVPSPRASIVLSAEVVCTRMCSCCKVPPCRIFAAGGLVAASRWLRGRRSARMLPRHGQMDVADGIAGDGLGRPAGMGG